MFPPLRWLEDESVISYLSGTLLKIFLPVLLIKWENCELQNIKILPYHLQNSIWFQQVEEILKGGRFSFTDHSASISTFSSLRVLSDVAMASWRALTQRRKIGPDKLEKGSEENKMQFNKDEVKEPLLRIVSSTNAGGSNRLGNHSVVRANQKLMAN